MRINRTRSDSSSDSKPISDEMATSSTPYVVWFLRGGDETLPDGSKQNRKPGNISIGVDRSGVGYRISLKDPASGFVAFHTVETIENVMEVIEQLLNDDAVNWIVDKFNKSR